MAKMNENVISFKRLSSNACYGYKIYVKEYKDDEEPIEYLLDAVPNPQMSLDILDEKSLKYNEMQQWQLKDEVVGIDSSSINVYINNNLLSTKNYTFNEYNGVLLIHTRLNEDDSIDIEYRLDIIRYIHMTDKRCEYTVEPIFTKNHLIGRHNIL